MADNGKVKWNAEANEKILLILLQHSKEKVPYDQIAKELGTSVIAVKSQIARLKAKVKIADGATNDDDDGDEVPAPQVANKRKRAPKAATAGKATAKKPKVAKTPAVVVEEDSNEQES